MSARALIADDEAHLAEHLRARLQHFWPALGFLPLAANGVEALRALNEEEPEIAFLDIRMPGLTGIELAKRIDTHTHVVRHRVRPVRRRGLRPPALDEVLAKRARAIPGAGGRLRWIRALKGELVQQIAVDDVLYFRASDKYTCVVTRDGESLIRLPLAELTGQLDAEAFSQIHRGTLVNMNEVAATRRDLSGRVFVKLKDGRTELAVSRAYAHLFKQM